MAVGSLDLLPNLVRQGAFDVVLITAPDRLARNYVHQMLLMEEFERCGCQIEFLDQVVLDARPAEHINK